MGSNGLALTRPAKRVYIYQSRRQNKDKYSTSETSRGGRKEWEKQMRRQTCRRQSRVATLARGTGSEMKELLLIVINYLMTGA